MVRWRGGALGCHVPDGGRGRTCGGGHECGIRDIEDSTVPEVFSEDGSFEWPSKYLSEWGEEKSLCAKFEVKSSNACWGDNSNMQILEGPGRAKAITGMREVTEGRGDLPVDDRIFESFDGKERFGDVGEEGS